MISKSEIKSITSLTNVIMLLVDSGMSTSTSTQMALLFDVALYPDEPQMERAKRLNLDKTTVSRGLARLAQFGDRSGAPLQLVMEYPDPNSRRRMLARLTPKGEALIKQVAKVAKH